MDYKMNVSKVNVFKNISETDVKSTVNLNRL